MPDTTSPSEVPAILASLEVVALERERRAADPRLAAKVTAVKTFQQHRFRGTYSDLLAHPRYAKAARFFLDELYGPKDFSRRDDQFKRVVPAVARLFPSEVTRTVASLGELHALSESLDTAMAEASAEPIADGAAYQRAWRLTGRDADRDQQIALTLEVGKSLDRYTQVPMLALSLRMMRGPAHAAGLSDLQSFLETGFETFKQMRGATEFLNTVEQRESALVARLFGPENPLSEVL